MKIVPATMPTAAVYLFGSVRMWNDSYAQDPTLCHGSTMNTSTQSSCSPREFINTAM